MADTVVEIKEKNVELLSAPPKKEEVKEEAKTETLKVEPEGESWVEKGEENAELEDFLGSIMDNRAGEESEEEEKQQEISEGVKKLEIIDHKVNEKETAAPIDEAPKARPNFPLIVKTNRIKLDES